MSPQRFGFDFPTELMASPPVCVPELIPYVVDNQGFYLAQSEQPAQAIRRSVLAGRLVRNIYYANTVLADNEGDIG